MEDTSENREDKLKEKLLKNVSIGLLAHVDAGKTTLAEGLLYVSGNIRKLGRVDHKDAFLDTYGMERERGITIFSKQARLDLGEKKVTLLDTPGHGDFSGEMERTLQVLDYAILVISGADGVQGHTGILWKLLARYRIPVFVFINKMDQEGTNQNALMKELHTRLSENCVNFTQTSQEEFWENLAFCEETAMEQYLEQGKVSKEHIRNMIRERSVFPCYFGSALKLWGVDALVEGILQYTECKKYPDTFGARVFKISRDERGNRLTHMKITGGSLKVKAPLWGKVQKGAVRKQEETEVWQEKADQLRFYSGSGYELMNEADAGSICAVTGLTHTFAGEGLGMEEDVITPLLAPVLHYRLLPPEGCNVHTLLRQLYELEEEEPLLHILWREETGEIHIQLMGEVQIEVLKAIILERFQTAVEFGEGSIVYKETLVEPVEGVGHFEPLRHYAEVHLFMEPGEPGSGLVYSSSCSEDMLDGNWQRLILTHLEEKKHKGVLTGSDITDMKITLIAGRAHQKHTEGGDFRQATYRAVRQGLKIGNCRLLEPVYEFSLEVPDEMIGRAMTDIRRMHGTCLGPQTLSGQEGLSLLTGTVPAAAMQGYQAQVISYTKGKGRMSCSLKGYEPCHNEAEVIEAMGYDSERDLENPTSSVFCAHGAGFLVDYNQVYDYMHLEGQLDSKRARRNEEPQEIVTFPLAHQRNDEKELEEIFRRTYGEQRQERRSWKKKTVHKAPEPSVYKTVSNQKKTESGREYLLVDGYNIIFGWEELNELAQTDIGAARGMLMDVLSNYQGYKKNTLILVFDAYKVEGNPGTTEKYHNIYVVYTKEAETADQYIEKATHEIAGKHKVTVATSDGLEQMIILGQGAVRMSAKGLWEELKAANREISGMLGSTEAAGDKNYLFDQLSKELSDQLEEIRLGQTDGAHK